MMVIIIVIIIDKYPDTYVWNFIYCSVNCWFKYSAHTNSFCSGKRFSERKQEFQTSLVETTSDLKALAHDL